MSGVRTRKILWLFIMAALIGTLLLIVKQRGSLNDEVILGGSDDVFIKVDELKDPLDDYDTPEEEDYSDLDFPEINIGSWQYMLVNAANSIGRYEPDGFMSLDKYGVSVDYDIYDAVKSLIKGAEQAGFSIYISSAYVSYSDQTTAFNELASGISERDGCTYEEAVQKAKKLLPYPGTDEHQSGLCIDISDVQRESYDYDEMDKSLFAWLDSHCADYGFIKRYPAEKADITGWDEPCHYRYVGKDAAKFISDNGLCLEEFIAHYK